MMIPSIDIQNGQAVQLIGGEKKAIDAGDPRPIAAKFAHVGEIALIDLDAAMGIGNNTAIMREICAQHPCRVGGGIRDVQTAIDWLDAGAQKVILGTAATPEILCELPCDRVIAALDARHDKVVVEGWKTQTDATIEDRMSELREYVSGFLVTFVEREGRMGGMPLERVKQLVEIAGETKLTAAGGARDADEIAQVDRLGADTQIGMALYTGAIDLADGFCGCLRSDREDGLWPTVVCDERGAALGLVYSNLQSVRESIETGKGVYYSRSRKGLWRKGESSGNTQELLGITSDCDRDSLRFTVHQTGSGFCHQDTWTCFGNVNGLDQLEKTIVQRICDAPQGSYTRRLLDDPSFLIAKLREEVDELAETSTSSQSVHEAADVLFFAITMAAQKGASLIDIERELDRRALKVSRRSGNAKPAYIGEES
ncbi:MAG: phosphoribosyl-ATP diphosphatase [Phycisphaerales bacterium]|nr:phosphoribosyl-ATP diphosphatase [Phycisphaerales bacterium]